MQAVAKGRVLGGVLLIVGTSIGAGMLALPVANAEVGFPISSLFLLVCWLTMTFSAFLILEVNLNLPPGSNMISMAKATLGKWGAVFAWITYLCLLYTLLSAYIAGGTDIFRSLFLNMQLPLPAWMCSTLFTGVLGFIVYFGIRTVDYVNTGLMFAKLGVYFILVFLLIPHINTTFLEDTHSAYILGPLMVLIAAFGYAIIIPSLRVYFQDDVKKIRRVILIGSSIPLFCYFLWDAAIMGVIPLHGAGSLTGMLHSGHSTSELTRALSFRLENQWITDFFQFFSSVCMLTAFLGVSLALSDFFSDALHLKKSGKQGVIIYAATFLPPLSIVLLEPNIFIRGLSYAGVFCVMLLMLLPNMMVYSSRYIKHFPSRYQVRGGKIPIILTGSLALIFIGIGISQLNWA